MKHWIIGSYSDRNDAERAVDKLADLGYGRADISVIMNENTRARDFADNGETALSEHDRGSHMARGAAGGGMLGGTVGAIVAAVAGTGAIGLTVATGGAAAPFIAGPIAAVLAGGGAGAAAGSVLGALVGAGMPANEVKRVEDDVNAGNIIVSVHADDSQAAEVRKILS